MAILFLWTSLSKYFIPVSFIFFSLWKNTTFLFLAKDFSSCQKIQEFMKFYPSLVFSLRKIHPRVLLANRSWCLWKRSHWKRYLFLNFMIYDVSFQIDNFFKCLYNFSLKKCNWKLSKRCAKKLMKNTVSFRVNNQQLFCNIQLI
jgi:hypothetical protein